MWAWKGGQTSAASFSRNCHMPVMPSVTSRAPGGLSLPLSGQKIPPVWPGTSTQFVSPSISFQLLPRMPLMGEPPFPRCKCVQKTPADEWPPALTACQSTPERVRLHGPPPQGGWREYTAETPGFPGAGSLPTMGCRALPWLLLLHAAILQGAGTRAHASGQA